METDKNSSKNDLIILRRFLEDLRITELARKVDCEYFKTINSIKVIGLWLLLAQLFTITLLIILAEELIK